MAELANVGRSTFYEHYRTKDDLLRATIQRPFNLLASLVDASADDEPTVKLLRHFRENPQVGRMLLGWPTRPVLASELAARILDRLPLQSSMPPQIIARQIAAMQLALIESWIGGRPAMSVESAAVALREGSAALAQVLARVR